MYDSTYKTVVITGGTGTFGQAMTRFLIDNRPDVKVRILSRSEMPQVEMAKQYRDNSRVTFILADVRDVNRLRLAFRGADLILHAAALKHLYVGERDPSEMVSVNVDGSHNVVRAAIDEQVSHAVLLSTDKACMPTSLYGATKMVAERLFLDGNVYAGGQHTTFSVTRYGNVMGSRGSVLPLYQSMINQNMKLPLNDDRISRFWMTIDEAVQLVWEAALRKRQGQIFIPVLSSFYLTDLIRAICRLKENDSIDNYITKSSIHYGEKIHEDLISSHEVNYVALYGKIFFINNSKTIVGNKQSALDILSKHDPYHPYCSRTWEPRLSVADIRAKIEGAPHDVA